MEKLSEKLSMHRFANAPSDQTGTSVRAASLAKRYPLKLANIDGVGYRSQRFPFRHGQRKHALVKLCKRMLGFGVLRHWDRPREGPICAFKPIAAIFLAMHVLFLLAAQHQRPVLDVDC